MADQKREGREAKAKLMPCKVVQLPGGAHAIVKMAKDRPRKCSVCRRSIADYKLCDFPVSQSGNKTCDAVLCDQCSSHRGDDVDYCPTHAAWVDGKLRP